MTYEEVFQQMSAHMIKGVMFHQQMTDYFDFLNLFGYKKMSEYHALAELDNYKQLHTYFLNHYNKLIPESQFENVDIIPKEWYEKTRHDIDIESKKNAVKEAFIKWIEWEKGTKQFFSQMYKELDNNVEVASAFKIGEFVEDVDNELKWCERKYIELQGTDFAMDFILDEQQYYYELYKMKLSK